MTENIQSNEIEIIKETFDEKREIMGPAPEEMVEVDEDIHQGGDFFITDTDEIIDLEFQMKEFNEEELAKYVELAEELYYKNKVHISIYILCPKNIRITAPECIIRSDASFNIKLACYEGNPSYDVFYHLKAKVNRKIQLTDEDLEAISMIPMLFPRKQRKTWRIKCFRLISESEKSSY